MTKSKPYYFECNSGWVPILNEMIKIIESDPVEVHILQIKEKFGRLRVYYDGGSEVTENAVREAERKCDETCEFCGEAGKIRNLPWMRILCDKHYLEEVARFKLLGKI